MKIIGYRYQSCFGTYIEDFLQEKRDAGFIYESEEWKLKHFDAFCTAESVSEPILTRELVLKWGARREGEALSTATNRVSVVRQFALYMASLGIEAYIPSHFTKTEKPVIHVLTDDEIRELFSKIDNYVPGQNGQVFQRLATEYKVIFRLIYCCGLRISEARKLKWIDIDWNNGTARIMQSKGRKDRLVYIADDLKSLLQVYGSLLKNSYNCESEWIFPAKDPAACLGNATLDLQFRTRWKETHFAENCDRAPTVHCLRHTYVVKRMNLWMEKGISLKEMMPFLSRYLGHSSPDDTFYYYHQVDSAFRIIRERDKTSSKVIPEVLSYE